MTLKQAIVQAAAPGSTGTQDFTDAVFASDCKAAIFISSKASAVDTATRSVSFSVGMTASTGPSSASLAAWSGDDGAGNTDCVTSTVITTSCYRVRDFNSVEGEAIIDSFLPDGVRINWSNASPYGELVTALLLGGDIEANIVSATWTAETVKTVSHGLSGAPEIIIGLIGVASGVQASIGWWASTGPTYGYANLYSADASATTSVHSAANTDGLLATKTTGSVTRTFTIGSVDGTTFDCTASASWASGIAVFLCLRSTGATPLVAQAGAFTTKISSTGTEVEVSGMSVAPSVLLCIPTLLTSLGVLSNDSTYGLMASVNNAGSTQYGGSTLIEDYGAEPDDAAGQPYCRTTADSALVMMAVDGSEDVVATVSSWDSGGVTLNYSNIGASAFQVPYLAFGVSSTVKKLKLFAHSSAAGEANIEGVVLTDTRSVVIGEFTGQTFETALESGKAVLYVPVSEFGGDGLTISDTPVTFASNANFHTDMTPCTVIEE